MQPLTAAQVAAQAATQAAAQAAAQVAQQFLQQMPIFAAQSLDNGLLNKLLKDSARVPKWSDDSSVSIRRHLQDVQRTFAVVGLNPADPDPAHQQKCIKLLYLSLDGKRTIQRMDRAMTKPGAIATWAAAVQTFLEVFTRAEDDRVLWARFDNLKVSKGQRVRDVANELQELVDELSPSITDTQAIDKLLKVIDPVDLVAVRLARYELGKARAQGATLSLPDVINTVCQMVEVETSKASGSNGHVPMELGPINYHRGRSPSPWRGGGQGASNQQWGGQNRDPSRGRSPGREQQQQQQHQQKPKLWPDPRKDSR
jgi:hypothetical protein